MSDKPDKAEQPERATKSPAHILVIRLSAMGDVAMTVPVLRQVTANYPQLKITVLTRSFFAPLFKGIPNISVYPADLKGMHNGVTGLARLGKELRKLELDAVADLHDVLRSNVLKTIFYFYGIPVKQIDKGRSEKKALTRPEKKVFKQLKSTHERYADVFAELGYPIDLEKVSFPQKQEISPKVREALGKAPHKWLGIAPFAQHSSKMYPLDLMEELLQKLQKELKLKLLFFGGGKAEKEVLEHWEQTFPGSLCVAGKMTFEEELSVISNLDAMLSMDSGNAHLAAMYGVPVVTLWGVTHPYAGFKAFRQPMENCLLPDLQKYDQIPTSIYGNKYPADYEEAMRSIPPERVLEKLREILE